MNKYILAALLALTAVPAYADGISCPEMAQMINEYEAKKKSGHVTRAEKQTIPSILAASYQSYKSAGCSPELLKSAKTRLH